MLQTAIIVPCRLESTRFPRKLLHPIRGRPLLVWVAERLTSEAPEFPLWFAVDHEQLRACVEAAGFRALLTDPAHPCGTDRIAEANRKVRAQAIINVQADEPLVTGTQIRTLATMLAGGAPMATLATPFRRAADFANPNQVKVVLAPVPPAPAAPGMRRALYFSRAPVPFARDRAGQVDDAWVAAQPCYKHLGLYGYRADLLERFAALPPGRLEGVERLEQLRVLENGFEIACEVTTEDAIGIDTLEDAERFEASLR